MYASAITYGYSVSPFIYLPAGATLGSSNPVQVQPDAISKVSPKIPSYSPLAFVLSLFGELPWQSFYLRVIRYIVRSWADGLLLGTRLFCAGVQPWMI